MKIFERLIPLIVMLLIAGGFFKLGMNYQKEKYIPCYNINLDSKPICNYCQRISYGDTLKFIDKCGNISYQFIPSKCY